MADVALSGRRAPSSPGDGSAREPAESDERSGPDLIFAPVVRPRSSVAELVVGQEELDVFDSGGLVEQFDQVLVEFGAPHLQGPR